MTCFGTSNNHFTAVFENLKTEKGNREGPSYQENERAGGSMKFRPGRLPRVPVATSMARSG